MSRAAVVVAAAGVAVFATLVTVPPGTATGEPFELAAFALGSGTFWRTIGVAFPLLAATWWWLGRAAGERDASVAADRRPVDRRLVEPCLWGAGAPLLSLLLDPWSFHGTVWITATSGLAIGCVVAVDRLRRSGAPLFAVPARGLALLVLLTIAIPTALALPGPPWFHPISGDEPHYLVTARSLWVDGDVDVANEYRQSLTQPFWNAELSPHAKPGIDPAAEYPIHGSGLSVWLAPWFGLGQGLSEPWFNALVRFAMSLWLAAATVALYCLLRELAGVAVALPGTTLAALTLPLLFAGPHLFPAVPVFALSCGAYVLLRRDVTVFRAALAGCMLACLPWLHFKFFGLMAAVAGTGLWFLWRSNGQGEPARATRATPSPADSPLRHDGRSAAAVVAALLVPMLVSAAGHVAFTWILYGRLSPLAIHVGADPTLRATAAGDDWVAYFTDPLGAATTAVGYFLDQREGLLFYAPQYLLAIAGFAWLARRRRADAIALVLAFVALVGPYALSQEIGHWAPPARPLTGVLWVLAAGMGIGLSLPPGAGRHAVARSALRAVLVTAGACTTVMLMLQPDLLYHDFNVGRSLALLRYGAPGLPLSDVAPLWLGPDAVHWGASLIALALIVGLGVLLWRWGSDAAAEDMALGGPTGHARPTGADSGIGSRAAIAFVLVAGGVMLAHHALVPLTDLHQSWRYGPLRYWRPQSPPTRAWGEPEGLWTGGNDTVDLLLSSGESVDQIILELDALTAVRAEVQLGRDRQSIHVVPGERALARLRPGPGRYWNGEYFYHLRVAVDGGASPAALGLGDDTRGLGVLLHAPQ